MQGLGRLRIPGGIASDEVVRAPPHPDSCFPSSHAVGGPHGVRTAVERTGARTACPRNGIVSMAVRMGLVAWMAGILVTSLGPAPVIGGACAAARRCRW